MGLSITTSEAPGKFVIGLSGQFDFYSNKEFRRAYDSALKNTQITEIEINLAQVNHIDSSALGMLLMLKDKAGETGQKIILSGATGTLMDVMKVASFDTLFTLR